MGIGCGCLNGRDEDVQNDCASPNLPPPQKPVRSPRQSARSELPPLESPKQRTKPRDIGNFIHDNESSVFDDFELDKRIIGQGSFGQVFKAKEKATGFSRAIKSISVQKLPNMKAFEQEMHLMARLSHPNCVKLYSSYRDPVKVYLVMEHCTGGELLDRIIDEINFTEKEAAFLMRQVLGVVNYLHGVKIAHRDIKPDNFMFLNFDPIEQSVLKIIDFGLAREFGADGRNFTTQCGTISYMAPEIHQGSYNHMSDLWACGVLMYLFLCGFSPFPGHCSAGVLAAIKEGLSFAKPPWNHVSENAKELVQDLLKIDPGERISAPQALEHVWVSEMAPRSSNVSLNPHIVRQLCGLRTTNKLKAASLHVIAKNWNEEQIKGLRDAFIHMDENGDGHLSLAEVRDGIAKHGGIELQADIEALWSNIDKDANGTINYEDFVAATLSHKEYDREDVCWAAFRQFDLDADGTISVEELSLMLKDARDGTNTSLLPKHNTMETAELMKLVDADGDMNIDFQEFMDMMHKESDVMMSRLSERVSSRATNAPAKPQDK